MLVRSTEYCLIFIELRLHFISENIRYINNCFIKSNILFNSQQSLVMAVIWKSKITFRGTFEYLVYNIADKNFKLALKADAKFSALSVL